jgi:hypothetical protein
MESHVNLLDSKGAGIAWSVLTKGYENWTSEELWLLFSGRSERVRDLALVQSVQAGLGAHPTSIQLVPRALLRE